MQRSVCNCSFNSLQGISSSLGQDTLSFDNILQIGSDFIGYFQTIIDCERCVTTKRMTNLLSQITSRLVCFYEAAYLNAATDTTHPRARSTSDAGLLLSPPRSQHGQLSPLSPATQPAPSCRLMFGEMKLGRLPLEGHEARILAEAFPQPVSGFTGILVQSSPIPDTEHGISSMQIVFRGVVNG
ncbi:hypothetical protein MKX07_003823 [Trichoderma sp. CBMAI-0711]|nr:hypothetical protein MKX07_003823 [Trichoderma sp. CBMAI-0711]